jgi:hypothetical protein
MKNKSSERIKGKEYVLGPSKYSFSFENDVEKKIKTLFSTMPTEVCYGY